MRQYITNEQLLCYAYPSLDQAVKLNHEREDVDGEDEFFHVLGCEGVKLRVVQQF